MSERNPYRERMSVVAGSECDPPMRPTRVDVGPLPDERATGRTEALLATAALVRAQVRALDKVMHEIRIRAVAMRRPIPANEEQYASVIRELLIELAEKHESCAKDATLPEIPKKWQTG